MPSARRNSLKAMATVLRGVSQRRKCCGGRFANALRNIGLVVCDVSTASYIKLTQPCVDIRRIKGSSTMRTAAVRGGSNTEGVVVAGSGIVERSGS